MNENFFSNFSLSSEEKFFLEKKERKEENMNYQQKSILHNNYYFKSGSPLKKLVEKSILWKINFDSETIKKNVLREDGL